MSDFHFIRPLWLLALIPIAGILIGLIRQNGSRRKWSSVVADHLLVHLVDETRKGNGVRPSELLGIVLVLTVVAVAGPAWEREPTAFADDEAALVIVVEVSPTMLAKDVRPSRMERAAQKITELLKLRRGSATALVAYSGSAHLVMPLTEDGDLIARFATELHPEIMPAAGDAAFEAIALARRQLTGSGRRGAILLVTDGVASEETNRIVDSGSSDPMVIHVLGVGSARVGEPSEGSPSAPTLNPDALKALAGVTRGSFVRISPDTRDVDRLASAIESRYADAPNLSGGERWQDYGYWLTPLIAILVLWWFRPGWTVEWAVILFWGAVAVEFQAQPLHAASAELDSNPSGTPKRFWFMTADQTAQRLFNAGSFAEAAIQFTDPMRQGVAWYRTGEFAHAAAAFEGLGTAEGYYNCANARVMMGEYAAAIKNYQAALKLRPSFKAAESNLKLSRARLARTKAPEDAQGEETVAEEDRSVEITFDDRGKSQQENNEEVPVGEGEDLSNEALRAQWLRRLETKPAEFLRLKFLYQYRTSQRGDGGGGNDAN